jgi:mannose-6-phosphate isomerase-like protein (cupin superfamily)
MAADLLGPDEGDVIVDRQERTALIKVAREELTLTWFRYVEGQKGPPPHVHREHSDGFYVIEGRMTFELGHGEVVHGDPGTLVLVPPNVVHTFRNEGPATGRFLNLHAPSCGFHDYLRARRDGGETDWFDQWEPPADGGRPASDALVGVGRVSRDGITLAEQDIDREERPAASTSKSTTYWVIDGSLTFMTDDVELEARAGSCVVVPSGAAHSVAGPARAVVVSA